MKYSDHMDKRPLTFYKRHVEEVLLPFWAKAVDKDNGGIYTCFNNTGEVLASKDKYTWSQGRFLWLWSQIARMISENKLEGEKGEYLDQLHLTAAFLEEHLFLENGTCAFLLTGEGQKKESIPGKGFDTSIYADCFVALGLGKFAGLTGDLQRFETALDLYNRIRKRIDSGHVRTEPYPIPEGYRAHSIPMIMLNVSQELADMANQLNHPEEEILFQHSISYMDDIMENFYRKDTHRVIEMLPEGSHPDNDTLLYRHLNPGHTIESMWFVIHTAQKSGHTGYVNQAARAIEHAIHAGWDPGYGGLFRFIDKEGGKPKGKNTSTPYEQLIVDSWDMKLWWPHSEALYATLLAFTVTGDEDMKRLYDKIATYTFGTFPNPDREVGEWIQIRDREGTPVDVIAALPVKDPFHILRSMLLIIDLLEQNDENN